MQSGTGSGAGMAPAPNSAIGEAVVDEAVHGLGRIGARLVDVSGSSGGTIDARFETVSALDNQARTLLNRVLKSPVAASASSETLAAQLIAATRDFFGILLNAYERSVNSLTSDPSIIGRLARIQDCRLRLMRAGADRVIWELCSGGPAHPHVWSWLGTSFVASESGHGTGRVRAQMHWGGPGASLENEYLRAVAAYSASLGLLPPRASLVVGRVMAFALPMLNFRSRPFAGATYYVCPREGAAPRRLVRPPNELDGGWFYSAGVAVGALKELLENLIVGKAPLALAAGEDGEKVLRTVLEHLILHWSETPPVRRFRRHMLDGTLSAVCGIDQLRELFSGRSSVAEVEWSLKDVSRGGLGAYICGESEPSVRVGQLVGVRANDCAAWHLAIVRRTWTGAGEYPFVGLETLSQRPVPARVDDGRASADVFLCDPILKGEALRIAAGSNQLSSDLPLFITDGGRLQKLKPLRGLVEGEGFDLRVYQVL
ncbi:hypothetical protein AZKH_1297 [Azoarcus sp. KH32C]|nr:hypothetical protein AZKH_1297 [Azoarcus sp. KH32C]